MTALAAERTLSILRSELGDFLAWLSDDNVVELLVNPDGSVWLDTHDAGLQHAGRRPFDATRSLLSTLATAHDLFVNDLHPILETNLQLPGTPFDGARVHGLWAPLSTPGPTLSIRKRRPYPYDLRRDFLAAKILTPAQADLLENAVADRLNILVCGGTGTGKTALATALLNLLPPVTERVILLEDVAEIVCPHLHTVPLRTNEAHGLPELVRTAMRLRPTRLVIGEVRGPEALNLLVAWTTGTPGGVTTLHADDCAGALQRLALLIQLAGVANPHPLIAQAVHLIVHIDGRGTHRALKAIARVQPQDGGAYATVPV